MAGHISQTLIYHIFQEFGGDDFHLLAVFNLSAAGAAQRCARGRYTHALLQSAAAFLPQSGVENTLRSPHAAITKCHIRCN